MQADAFVGCGCVETFVISSPSHSAAQICKITSTSMTLENKNLTLLISYVGRETEREWTIKGGKVARQNARSEEGERR